MIPTAPTTTGTSKRSTGEVEDSIQRGMDALVRKRAFPLFG
jgi:hypothetical protein